MNVSHNLMLPIKVAGCKLSRYGFCKTPMPVTLTYSITNMCQSRCKTCNLWKVYIDNPELKKNELKIGEIEKIFQSIGHLFFFNISGGEPYLRKDLVEIVDLACKYLSPGVIHTPTNALAPKLIEKKTIEMLEVMRENRHEVPFTIKPSFDGIGKKHDEIRGVKGNFEKVLDTVTRLKEIQKDYPNLQVNLGTVISNFNTDNIVEISDYAHKLDVDSYINEIAEQRSELFTLNEPITPTPEKYEQAIEYFSSEIREDIKSKSKLSRYTQSFRLVYYDIVVQTLREKRQVLPCYAGISNAHINPYGEVWPCCILGYDKPMGDLREANYDFKRVWHSRQANDVRGYIMNGNCYCPLANQAYSNILCDFRSMLKVLKNIISI